MRPRASVLPRLAPALRRRTTISVWPQKAARMSGVCPPGPVASTASAGSEASSTVATCADPARAAVCSGVISLVAGLRVSSQVDQLLRRRSVVFARGKVQRRLTELVVPLVDLCLHLLDEPLHDAAVALDGEPVQRSHAIVITHVYWAAKRRVVVILCERTMRWPRHTRIRQTAECVRDRERQRFFMHFSLCADIATHPNKQSLDGCAVAFPRSLPEHIEIGARIRHLVAAVLFFFLRSSGRRRARWLC